jgi:hypothetical protein
MRKGLTGVAAALYFLVARVGGFVAEIVILVLLVQAGHPVLAVIFFFIGTPILFTLTHLVGLLVAMPFAVAGDDSGGGEAAREPTRKRPAAKEAIPLEDLSFVRAISGELLATGQGTLEGVRRAERSTVTAEARRGKLLVFGKNARAFPYESLSGFRVDNVGDEEAIHLSVAEDGVQDRWQLAIVPDDLEAWERLFLPGSAPDPAVGRPGDGSQPETLE